MAFELQCIKGVGVDETKGEQMAFRQIHLKALQAVAIVTVVLLASCGGGSSFQLDDDSGDTDETSSPALTLEGITPIEFDANGNASVSFENVAADNSYLVTLYSSNYETSGGLFAFEIGSGSSANVTAALTRGVEEDSADITEDAHELLRLAEEELNGDLATASSGGFTRSLSASRSAPSSRTFKVLSSLSSASSYSTVTADLRYETADLYVYVDTRNSDEVSDDALAQFVAPFADLIDDERGLFGAESDVNDDDHFTVLLTQEVNELGQSGGGIITGFFYAADLYSASSYPVSNEMEIIYTMVPDPEGDHGVPISQEFALANILPSVLPHEFQHMINYNQHVFLNGGAAERSYLNEALAHLAEDIYSLNGGYMAETGIENPARVAYYLDDVDGVCFTCGSSLSQRGGSYLFIRYLYEQAEMGNLSAVANGASLIASLMNTTKTGMANIVGAALGSSDASDFHSLISLFNLAVTLSDTGLSSDNRFEFSGIDLHGEQNDNRGTILDGPVTVTPSSFPYQSTITASGLSYVEISGAEILNMGGVLPVAIGAGMTGGGYVITLQ